MPTSFRADAQVRPRGFVLSASRQHQNQLLLEPTLSTTLSSARRIANTNDNTNTHAAKTRISFTIISLGRLGVRQRVRRERGIHYSANEWIIDRAKTTRTTAVETTQTPWANGHSDRRTVSWKRLLLLLLRARPTSVL